MICNVALSKRSLLRRITIWWHKFMPGGRGVNVLTSDEVADMGGGPAFHSTAVEVERVEPAEAVFPGRSLRAATAR
jgi:hypothetical protein